MLYAEIAVLCITAALALFGLPPDAPAWMLLTTAAMLAYGLILVIVDIRREVK